MGTPDLNSDQGSQLTSAMWTSTLEELGIPISMDGKGRAIDNRWIERFWRTLKYKYIYLNPPADGLELYEGVNEYIEYYNHEQTHQTFKEIPRVRYQKSKTKQQLNRIELLTKKLPEMVEIMGSITLVSLSDHPSSILLEKFAKRLIK